MLSRSRSAFRWFPPSRGTQRRLAAYCARVSRKYSRWHGARFVVHFITRRTCRARRLPYYRIPTEGLVPFCSANSREPAPSEMKHWWGAGTYPLLSRDSTISSRRESRLSTRRRIRDSRFKYQPELLNSLERSRGFRSFRVCLSPMTRDYEQMVIPLFRLFLLWERKQERNSEVCARAGWFGTLFLDLGKVG